MRASANGSATRNVPPSGSPNHRPPARCRSDQTFARCAWIISLSPIGRAPGRGRQRAKHVAGGADELHPVRMHVDSVNAIRSGARRKPRAIAWRPDGTAPTAGANRPADAVPAAGARIHARSTCARTGARQARASCAVARPWSWVSPMRRRGIHHAHRWRGGVAARGAREPAERASLLDGYVTSARVRSVLACGRAFEASKIQAA